MIEGECVSLPFCYHIMSESEKRARKLSVFKFFQGRAREIGFYRSRSERLLREARRMRCGTQDCANKVHRVDPTFGRPLVRTAQKPKVSS